MSTKKAPAKKRTPKGKIFLVIQQGGSSREFYVHAHDTEEDARNHIKSCEEAAYNTAGPIEVPQELTKVLLANEAAERAFYQILEESIRAAAAL
jgi:hypothetical protein